MLPFATLGERIVILGPSNAGKSTLAVALSEKLGIPAVHLDQLHHLPDTNWQPRPEAEFAALHDAILEESILATIDTFTANGNGGIEADRQVSGLAGTDGLRSVNDDLQLIENPPNAVDKVPPCRGRPDTPIGSLEQRDSKLLLQMSDSAAKIRLFEG
jgi:hypothetical protein